MKPKEQTLAVMVLLAGFLFAGSALSESQYITDIIYVPMRAGPGNQYKILHQGLKTGTEVTILEAEAGNGFSKVVTDANREGYIRSQYLLKKPPAQLQLPIIQAAADKENKNNNELKERLAESENKVKQLVQQISKTTQQMTELKSQLKKIQDTNDDTVVIHQRNKQLVEENWQLNSRVELLESDNNQLLTNYNYTWYLYGGGTILLGILLGLILPWIGANRKRSSDWS